MIQIVKQKKGEQKEMKFIIHNTKYNDSILIEGVNIEDVKEKTLYETDLRCWDRKDCWSEEVKENENDKERTI